MKNRIREILYKPVLMTRTFKDDAIKDLDQATDQILKTLNDEIEKLPVSTYFEPDMDAPDLRKEVKYVKLSDIQSLLEVTE